MKDKKISLGWGFGGCNMNCRHCYAGSGSSCPKYSLAILEQIADKIAPNIDAINYGTGEFCFNLNTIPLAEYLKEKYPHIRQAVTTNGSLERLLSPEKIKSLFHDVDFSLDFPDPERHIKFRRHRLAWKWVMESLEICAKNDIPCSIVTCVTARTGNDDIKELLEIARQFKASWRINWFRPTGRGLSEQALKLTPQRVWDILALLAQSAKVEALSDPLFDAVLRKDYSRYNGCACGVMSCRIQTNLSVTPCVFLGGKQWSGGSILKHNLEEIFASRAFERFRNRQPKYCLKCGFWERCRGGCGSRAVLYRGSLNEPDGFCPFVAGIPQEKVDEVAESLQVLKGTEQKVHDGYLCTLIADPK